MKIDPISIRLMDHRAHLYRGFAPISNDQSIRSTLIYCAFTTAIWLIRGNQPWEIAVMLSRTFYCAVCAINILTILVDENVILKIERRGKKKKRKRRKRRRKGKRIHIFFFFFEDLLISSMNRKIR